MPIMTALLTTRVSALPAPPSRAVPASDSSTRLAHHSWPMISLDVRLRLKPWWPVEQKRQLTAQPAWLDTHSVPRSSSGMKTVSMALPCPTSNSHLRVPSEERCSRSEEHTSELQSLMRISYAVICLKKKQNT